MLYSDLDGDFGLSDRDTAGEFAFGQSYFYNLLCFIEEKQNGNWSRVEDPFTVGKELYFHERIPPVVEDKENEAVSGSIELKIPARPLSLELDTVRFKLQIIDRGLQKSSLLNTKEFHLKHP